MTGVASVPGRTHMFLLLPDLSAGASWVCCFRAHKLADAARVAPIGKLSVVLLAARGVAFLGERLPGPTGWASP